MTLKVLNSMSKIIHYYYKIRITCMMQYLSLTKRADAVAWDNYTSGQVGYSLYFTLATTCIKVREVV